MAPCKRIEIVSEETLTRRMAQMLEAQGTPGYTLIPRASGQGDRGARRADDPTGPLTNAVFIIAALRCCAESGQRFSERALMPR